MPEKRDKFLKSIQCNRIKEHINDKSAILELAKKIECSSAETSLLDFALGTRHYSPRVKVQFTKNTNVSKSALNHPTEQSVDDILHLDHVFNVEKIGRTVSFLYSDISEEKGCLAVQQMLNSEKPFVLRMVRLVNGEVYHEQRIKETYMKDGRDDPESKDLLSIRGYGVELQIKNLEYKQTADDDSGKATYYKGVNFNELKKNYSHLSNDLDTLKLHLQQSDSKTEKLRVWEMKHLGIQATSLIMHATSFDDKLALLQDISHNFPSFVKILQNTPFGDGFKNEVQQQLGRFEGDFKARNPNNPQEVIRRNALFLNGVELDLSKLSIFSLFDALSKEINFIKTLTSKYLITKSSINSLLFKTESEKKEIRFRLPKKLEEQVIWFNDIEGHGYNNFPRELRTMLSPTMYGQIRFCKRNLFNVVFMIDPASTQKHVAHLLYILGNIMNRGYPVRIGALFVPQVTNNAVDVDISGSSTTIESQISELSLYTVSLLETISKEARVIFPVLREFLDKDEFDIDFVKRVFKQYNGRELFPANKDTLLERYKLFTEFGFDVTESPIILLNGAVVEPDEPGMPSDQIVHKGIREQYDNIKNLIENKIIVDSDSNLLDKMLTHYAAFDMFSPSVFNNQRYSVVSLEELEEIDMIQNPDNGNVKKTQIICLNNAGMASDVISEAVSFVKAHPDTRIGILMANRDTFAKHKKFHSVHKPFNSGVTRISSQIFCEKYANPEQIGVISMNGRVVSYPRLTAKDLEILNVYEGVHSSMISVIESNQFSVDADLITSDFLSDILFGVSSVMKTFNQHSRQDMSYITPTTSTTIRTDNVADLKLIAIINPLSKEAQRFTPMLRFLKEKLGNDIEIVLHLNPDLDTSSLPLQSYYTFVLSDSSMAEFKTMYNDVKGRIFTMWMDVPESWLVESTFAKEDLDNLKLDECLVEKCYARFQLEYFVATGTCIDDKSKPVRGLQLQLVPNHGVSREVDDTTLVMANFGYFQLRASTPNLFSISLPEGRHSQIYSIQSTKQVNFYSQQELQYSDGSGPANTKNFLISVDSFDAPFARVVVKRNPGMEGQDLLAEAEQTGSWSSWLSTKKEDQTIHIFSLASGLMYERLLKIMILSVRKHLKRSDVKVKFWFLKQFLSPSFKQFLPEYAKAYNFEYGLISYQWPHWLHKQSTKQRLIWAYKVLFLDVLFPLQEVHKIIFVDADQVCRTDMSELFFDLDMQGKALAYTPFCDSRKDMDGYRFWKSGYWASHLGGRPYHISALYVVDIDMFRRNYYGDQFRMVYDTLARDPNSLSNLDQDLPNYAQHSVPIRSLPQDWLWCESWCSKESKATAKTIDLCNNPMTKEHKLASAKRIIPEWIDYDNEIKDFQKKIHAL